MRPLARLAALLLVGLVTMGAGVDDATRQPLDAATDRYRRLMTEGRNAEAIAAGQEVLTLTRQRYGDDSVELASPLIDLGVAQLRNGDLRAAETTYQTAIALLEKREGYLSPRLTNPLVGLGEIFVRSELYPQATATYERALHVHHVNEGFYNPDQMTIRDGLTEGYFGLQEIEKANFHQEVQLNVHQRKLGKDNPELVGALTKLGRWYARSNQVESARLAYQSATRLVEKSQGENAPTLVEPLLAIAQTYQQQALRPTDLESDESPSTLLPLSSMTLRKALGIVEQQQPPDPAQRARILVELGDLYMLWGKQNTASSRYQEAWQALSADPTLRRQRDQYFAQPVRIMGPIPPAIFPLPSPKAKATAATPNDLEPGYVVVRCNVNQFGRVTEVTVVEADPANLLEQRVTDATKNGLFRPRYVNGTPTATTGLLLRHEYRYAPTKLKNKDAPAVEEDNKPLAQPTSSTDLPDA